MSRKFLIMLTLLLAIAFASSAMALQHPAGTISDSRGDGFVCGQDTFDHGDYGLDIINGDDDWDHQPPPPVGRKDPPAKKQASWEDLLGYFYRWLI